MAVSKPQSSFLVEKDKLSKDELWNILRYTSSPENTQGEKWEVSIEAKYNWVNGVCRGEDIGQMWQFLQENFLDDRVEIIRG